MHDDETTTLLARARSWLAEDPDPETRAELTRLVDAADGGERTARDELAERFAGTLQFGTAGLRGELGAGPMRMNRAVVIRAAAGLAAYLREQEGALAAGAGGGTSGGAPGGTSGSTSESAAASTPGSARGGTSAGSPGLVVIGYDARHKSREFATDTAAVVTGAGLRAALLPEPLPTPVLAFAVRHLGAVAGVMVTASHNPPRDNGYKVYLGDGAQIVPPADADIADAIDAVGPLAEVPRPESGWSVLGRDLLDSYLARTGAVLTEGTPRDVRVVHTALHGVGARTVHEAFVRAGFPAPLEVPQQAAPDPEFPTVAFPNPEEPGAMDLAYATAREAAERGEPADLVIANDPDADRCAVAVPDASADGGWRMLRGDEVGALLATHLVHKRARGAFATTIVSSSLLSRIAHAADLPYAETLTGFKWLARVKDLRYGCEEALGYCVDPQGVLDKDGVTAALLIAELAAELKAADRGLDGLLDDLAVEYGLHATDQLSVRVEDLSVIADAMALLRARPPVRLAGLAVTSAEDLTEGSESLPPTDGLRYYLGSDAAAVPDPAGTAGPRVRSARVVVRPSGTEPKLKCYLEVVVPVRDQSVLASAREQAAATLAALKSDLAEAAGV